MITADLIKIIIADALVFTFILWLFRYNSRKRKPKTLEEFTDDDLLIWEQIFIKLTEHIEKHKKTPEAVPNHLDDCLMFLITNYNIKKNE